MSDQHSVIPDWLTPDLHAELKAHPEPGRLQDVPDKLDIVLEFKTQVTSVGELWKTSVVLPEG